MNHRENSLTPWITNETPREPDYGPTEKRIAEWLAEHHRNPHRISVVGSPTGRFAPSTAERWPCPGNKENKT